MKKLTQLLKESQHLDYRRMNVGEEDGQGMTKEEKRAFVEAVAAYRQLGEMISHKGNISEIHDSIKGIVENANNLTLKETGDWFDRVTVQRHMKSMNESFKVFSNTIKEVSTLQQRLESSYDEIGEVLGKYYEIKEGNEFGAERAKAIAAGNDSFEVDGKSYKVSGVDAEDKKNAEEFANESMKLTSLIKRNEELTGKQKELDVDSDGDIEADDLADLRAGKKADESVNEAKFKVLASFGGYDLIEAPTEKDMIISKNGKKVGKLTKISKYLKDDIKSFINMVKSGKLGESVNEGRKSKDSSGVRYVNAIYNNTNAIVKLVMDEKKDPKEVVDTMGPVLINAIKATLAHNYKPNSQPAYTLKRDLQRLGDLSNQQRIDVFKKGLKELLAVATELVKRPSQVGVKKLEERFRKLWNNEYGANIGLNGQGPHENTIIESVNEGVSPADMDKIKGAVEAASSFMSVGGELKKLGMKYTFATEPLPIYIIQPTPNNKVAIVNKKYATKPDFVVGDIAVGIMEGKLNEEEIKWNAVENAIINFLKMNTKILDKRVQAKDTEGVKGGLKSIISGLVNAQRNLKLESVNEAGYTVKAENPYQFVNGAYAVLSAYLKDEELGPKGKRELQDIIKSLDYMRKYFYFKMSESVNEIKKGSIVMPYAMDKYGEFIVDKVFKNKSGETSYTGKFKKSGESREFILHSKDKVVKESVNEEKYTVIDPMGNQKGVGPKIQAISMAKRLGGEKTGHFVVANTNALKARRALEKFKGDFKNPKLKDMMMNLYYESVNERIVKEKVK